MLNYVATNLFSSPAQTLVNTVNTVGVMGKGIAVEFKERYPDMFRAYQKLCKNGTLDIGKLHIWRASDHWIVNFPTKTTWKKPSELQYIKDGLETFVNCYREMKISSISFPPLGCGNGNLEWKNVKPVMEAYLRNLEIPVYIHDRQVARTFVPEHSNAVKNPASYEEFLADVRGKIRELAGSTVKTLSGAGNFSADYDGESILIRRNGGPEIISPEYLEWAWTALQHGFLTAEQFPSEESKRVKAYLFAILARLPYVAVTDIKSPKWQHNGTGHALYLSASNFDETGTIGNSIEETNQLCLSLSSEQESTLKIKHAS